MNWKFIFYDWYGLNAELFEAINAGCLSRWDRLCGS